MNYINEYDDGYSYAQLRFISDVFYRTIQTRRPSKRYIMNEIYAFLGLLADENNKYKGFVELLKQKYEIGVNAVEIAGGFFPNSAIYIDEEQHTIGRGTITVYDENLVTNKLGNIILNRRNFTLGDDLGEYRINVCYISL